MASQIPEDQLPPPINPTPPPPPPPPAGNGLVGRIGRLITTPTAEWQRIDAEPMTVGGIMTGWVLPLAAIGPICTMIGSMLFGYGVPGLIVYRPSFAVAVSIAVMSYFFAVVGVFLMALIFDALAPSFGSQKNQVQAMKAAAYSMTASWLAGVFTIIPMLSLLAIVGLYSFFLLWIGLPIVMKTPEDKKPGYVIVSIVVAVIVYIVFIAIAAAFSRMMFAPALGVGSLAY